MSTGAQISSIANWNLGFSCYYSNNLSFYHLASYDVNYQYAHFVVIAVASKNIDWSDGFEPLGTMAVDETRSNCCFHRRTDLGFRTNWSLYATTIGFDFDQTCWNQSDQGYIDYYGFNEMTFDGEFIS